MRRRAVLFSVLLLLVAAPSAPGAEDLAEARRRFLSTRDATALEAAMAETAPRDADAVTDARLAGLASMPDALHDSAAGAGYAAIPDAVVALRRLDLEGAESALVRARQRPVPHALDRWLEALLAARRGRDVRARGALRELPTEVAPGELEAFRLALLGTALPVDDRLFLAGTARGALLEAAAEGDLEDVERLGRRLAALDRRVGGGALCLVARAWGLAGEVERGASVLEGPEARWVEGESCHVLERAVWRWREGRRDLARALVASLGVPPGVSWLVDALRGEGPASPPPPRWEAPAHVMASRRSSHLVARMATALGVETTPAEVDARALALGLSTNDAAFAARFLAERDLAVRYAAGGAGGLEEAVALGFPVLLLHLEPVEEGFEEVWRLVRGRDEASGLWVAETGNLEDRGLLAPNLPRESRMLLAAPADQAARLAAGVPEAEQRLGANLFDALEIARGGDLRDGVARLREAYPESPPFVAGMLAAWLLQRRYVETQIETPAKQDREALGESDSLLEPFAELDVLSSFVPYGLGECRVVERSPAVLEEAARFYERAQALRPDSAHIARSRYRAHILAREGERAVQAIDLARELDPLDVVSLYLRGRTRRGIGQTDLARADLRRAVDRRPDWVLASMELVGLELAAGRPQAALDALVRLTERVSAAADQEAVRAARTMAEGMLVQRAASVEDLRALMDSPEAQTRRRVAFELVRWETDDSEVRLRRYLSDEDESVRVTTIRMYMRPWLCRRIERDTALGRLVQDVLRTDDSMYVRGAAAALLGLVPAPWAAAALATTLAGERADASPYVRIEAAGALELHGTLDVARSALVDALADPDMEVRRAALRVLHQIAGTTHGYQPDGPPEERAAAIRRWREWLE